MISVHVGAAEISTYVIRYQRNPLGNLHAGLCDRVSLSDLIDGRPQVLQRDNKTYQQSVTFYYSIADGATYVNDNIEGFDERTASEGSLAPRRLWFGLRRCLFPSSGDAARMGYVDFEYATSLK